MALSKSIGIIALFLYSKGYNISIFWGVSFIFGVSVWWVYFYKGLIRVLFRSMHVHTARSQFSLILSVGFSIFIVASFSIANDHVVLIIWPVTLLAAIH